MLSESARMNSAAEARFRIQAPNSRARRIKVIALDEPSETVVRRLAETLWTNATFFTAGAVSPASDAFSSGSRSGWLRDLEGHPRDLINEVEAADLVVMLATPGQDAQASSMIGEACSHNRVMTTTLVVGSGSASDAALSRTLAQLRPWSLMVVIANADDYVEDMLIALRGK